MVNEIFVLAQDSTVFQIIGDVNQDPMKPVSNFLYSNGPCIRVMSCKKTKILFNGPNGIHTVWHQNYGEEFGNDLCVELSLDGINFISRLPKTDSLPQVRYSIVPVPIAGLFLCQWAALGMHLRKDLTFIDKIALPFTKEVMFSVGINNPSFVFSLDFMKIVLSVI